MYKVIVAGTDGTSTSRAAVSQAADLARLCGAKLHLVSAYRTAGQSLMAVPAGEALAVAGTLSDAEIHAEAEALLRKLASELRRDGVDVEIYACPQSPAQALLDVAAHQNADLVVVGNRGMRGARRILGSVPNTVAHQATCSVLVVHTC